MGTHEGRAVDPEALGPADPNAPTRVMRQGGEDVGPRPGHPGPATDEPPVALQGGDSTTGPQRRSGGVPRISGLGSTLLARQPSPNPGEGVAVRKVCPHCGTEYETDARFCPKDGTALRPTGGSDPLIGETLGDRYHILSLVGEGGMGRIYLAEHVRMSRQCAVKIMRPNLVNDADAAARFAREASSAARIIHPNVAAVFDYGESDGRVYLVMEYVEGESLGAILERERVLTIQRAVDFTKQVADALGAAHELGIVHRDLKPDNILVARTKSGKEVAKVVDFGIAKAIEEGPGQKLTETGLVIGTPEFMSPEQLMGDPVDARSDVYSLGCILYLMVVGRPAADAPTREGMLKRRLNESAPHAAEANEAIPPELDAVITRALATSPDERFQSAAELRAALDALPMPTGESVPVVNDVTGPTAKLPSHQTGARPRPLGAHVTPRRAGVAGVLVLGAVSLFLLQGDRGEGANDGRLAARPDSIPVQSPPVLTTPDSAALRDTAAAPDKAGLLAREEPPRPSPRDSARADSIRKAQAAQRALQAALQRPVQQFASGLRSKNLEQMKRAYPGLTPQQEAGWRNNFAAVEQITASVRFRGEPTVAGDSASYSVVLRINGVDTPYLASYRLRGGTWALVGLSQRP